MPRCESLYIDGVGKILVERTVLDRCPKHSGLWDEMSWIIPSVRSRLEVLLVAQRSDPVGREMLLSDGAPNAHLSLSIGLYDDESQIMFIEHVWVSFIRSSSHGKIVGTVIIVRDDPPDVRRSWIS